MEERRFSNSIRPLRVGTTPYKTTRIYANDGHTHISIDPSSWQAATKHRIVAPFLLATLSAFFSNMILSISRHNAAQKFVSIRQCTILFRFIATSRCFSNNILVSNANESVQ